MNVFTFQFNEFNEVTSGPLIVWYIIAGIVFVMVSVLLLSFYKYHRRLHKRQRHHIDYMRSNLPLVRPRISPPTMSSAIVFKYHVSPNPTSSRQQSRDREYITYTRVPMEDDFDDVKMYNPVKNREDTVSVNNLIVLNGADFETRDLFCDGNESFCTETWSNVICASPTIITRDDFPNAKYECHRPQNLDSDQKYVPKFQPWHVDVTELSGKPSENILKRTSGDLFVEPPSHRGVIVDRTRKSPSMSSTGSVQKDMFKICELPKPNSMKLMEEKSSTDNINIESEL